MTQNEASVFLMELTTIYPTLKIGYETAKVWSDHLPDLSLEKAKDLLDKWLEGENGDKAPKLDYFVKGGKIRSGGGKTVWANVPIVFHVEFGALIDQEGREYADPGALGPYRNGSAPYEVYNSEGERIQWMDERGYIHNGRGTFFKIQKEATA